MSTHPAHLDIRRLLSDCDVQRSRRRGPGGQHRNKVETAVTITHRPTGLSGGASERRRQEDNRRVALFRLRLNLAVAVRAVVDDQYRPSELWQSRCQRGRVSVNPEHKDFPAMLAEALDVLAARDFDPGASAELLGCSPSQLLKLLRHEPRAVTLVNRKRVEQGRRPLH